MEMVLIRYVAMSEAGIVWNKRTWGQTGRMALGSRNRKILGMPLRFKGLLAYRGVLGSFIGYSDGYSNYPLHGYARYYSILFHFQHCPQVGCLIGPCQSPPLVSHAASR